MSHASAIAGFGYELGILERIRRSGWWHGGVRDPESVAEHSLRVAQLAGFLAAGEGADPRTVRPYLAKPDPRQITADRTAPLPDAAGTTVRSAVDEYEAADSAETRRARDATSWRCCAKPSSTGRSAWRDR